MRNPNAFHAPLDPDDTEKETRGCRHTNPDICAKNRIPNKCAFVTKDGMCYAPPTSWPKQFRKLQEANKK
jgi:hypothetical protein